LHIFGLVFESSRTVENRSGIYCPNSGGAIALNMVWIFTGSNTTSVPYSVISSTGSATGVGVQIIDSSGNPAISGLQATEIASTANGINNLNYSVRYYQTAPTVAVGTVSATATFTATYQ
jgi:type 1 fimbria pilin